MMSNAAVYLANYIDSFSTGSSRGHTGHSPTREADTEDLGNKVSFGRGGDPQNEDNVAAAKMGNTFFSLTKVNVNVDIKFNIYLKSNTMAPYIESHYRFYSRLDLAFQS